MHPIITRIKEIVADGWQVQSVWIVPPTSQVSRGHEQWEAHIKSPNFVSGGEGGNNDISITINRCEIPDEVKVTHREKVADEIIELPPMSDEQADAIAAAVHRAGDASATHKTASGCWSIGPTAAWCRDPLRTAILNSRKK